MRVCVVMCVCVYVKLSGFFFPEEEQLHPEVEEMERALVSLSNGVGP